MLRNPKPIYDFSVLGQAIKNARMARRESREKVSDEINISPRYLANIENAGQQPSFQVFYELVTRYNISIDQYFYPDEAPRKSTLRRQLHMLLDDMNDKEIRIMNAVAKELSAIENEH